MAARTLGDIVRKLGEKVLPEIIPILEKGLESDDADQRQGVCIGLSEIMSSTSRDHVSVVCLLIGFYCIAVPTDLNEKSRNEIGYGKLGVGVDNEVKNVKNCIGVFLFIIIMHSW